MLSIMKSLWQPPADHFLSVSISNRTDTGPIWRKDPFNPIPLICEFQYNLVVKIRFEVFNYKPVLYSIYTMFVIYYKQWHAALRILKDHIIILTFMHIIL